MLHRLPASLLPCATAALLCLSSNVQAASQTYTSEADFLAAVGVVQTETFNRFTSDVSEPDFDLGDFRVQGSWTVDAPASVLDVNGSTNLLFTMSSATFADLVFDTPVRAFGAWFKGVPDTIKFDAAALEGPGSFRHVATLKPTGNGLQFIGFTSDQTFNRVVFESPLCCRVQFAIDNVSHAANLAPVPEPGSWALLAAGLGLLVGRRRHLRS